MSFLPNALPQFGLPLQVFAQGKLFLRLVMLTRKSGLPLHIYVSLVFEGTYIPVETSSSCLQVVFTHANASVTSFHVRMLSYV